MPQRKRRVMPLGDSSNRIRPRTPDARVERTADKPALLKSTTDMIENDEIPSPSINGALVTATPEEKVKSEQHTPSSPLFQAATAIEPPSPIKSAPVTSGCVTTTPPRPPYQPPTVVETCPTPPSSSSTATTPSRRVRRRPLLDEQADGCIVGEEVILPSSSSLSGARATELLETAEQVEPITMAAAAAANGNADVARKGSLDLPGGSSKTHVSSRRRRRTPRPSSDTTMSTPPLPDLDPADLVSALLSQSLPVPASRRNSGDSPRLAATSPHSERPRPTDSSRSAQPANLYAASRAIPPLPLEGRSRSGAAPRSPPFRLRPQPSTTTLFSWDLAHLPAPDAPREKPYRVSWTSVLLPTRYLGGGRGSGRYGDQWGPVERKGAARSSSLAAAAAAAAAVEGARSRPAGGEDETARSNPRWKGRRSSAAAATATAARASPSVSTYSATSGRLGVDSSASLASSRKPEPIPSEAETRRRRPESILRRWSRSSVASWAANSSSTTDPGPATVSRRQSLVASLFGAKSTASKRSGEEEEEDLHQWISVVLR